MLQVHGPQRVGHELEDNNSNNKSEGSGRRWAPPGKSQEMALIPRPCHRNHHVAITTRVLNHIHSQ